MTSPHAETTERLVPPQSASAEAAERAARAARQRRLGERGQTIVEFGLVSIVFFMLVFGIMDVARLFQSWVAIQHASREGARYAITGRIDCPGLSNDRPGCIVRTSKNATAGLTGGGLSGTDISVSYKSWDYPSYAGAGLASNAGQQCDAVQVTVSYTHHFVTPFLLLVAPSGVPMSGSQRMVNEPFGPCS